jgi:hypothetical protein
MDSTSSPDTVSNGIVIYERPRPAIAHNHFGKQGAFIDDSAGTPFK